MDITSEHITKPTNVATHVNCFNPQGPGDM